MKNMKIHLKLDESKKLSNEKRKKINYNFRPPSNLLHHLNKNREIEYNILDGIVFPILVVLLLKLTNQLYVE